MPTTSSGHVRKLVNTLKTPVEYALPLDDELIPLNPFLGESITLTFTGKINCVACGRSIKKSYKQGYCYPCTQTLAQCDFCILKPSLCHYHKGTCREPEWGEQHCMQPHCVYLANSSGVKVGITRYTQIPTRWIDQGAMQALPMLRVASRFQSGLLEEEFIKHVADKTNWRKMLSQDAPAVDLVAKRAELIAEVKDAIELIREKFSIEEIEILEDTKITEITYPILEYPEKVRSLNFDKTPEISGKLMGIKGQYLILDCGVLNIRKFGGYCLEFKST